MSSSPYARFESVMAVRPDDIDMNQHVHSSRYQDYVLAARYDQMARCYGMAMEDFSARGLGWVVKTAHMDYKRPLRMGDTFRVRTWIEGFRVDGVSVGFEILREPQGKLCCAGWCDYTLVALSTGRAVPIPPEIMEKYSVLSPESGAPGP
jgi:YbgC/YbaW family acyl-CoA thioester hydrolase